MVKVSVIKPGVLVRTPRGELKEARSSVTMIESNIRILVDTGYPGDDEEILAGLERLALSPKDIDVVLHTHLHIDHRGATGLFPDARWLAHPFEISGLEGFEPIRDGDIPAEGVRILATPGHTEGSVSVVVKAEKVYVIAGDAVPTESNWRKWVVPAIHKDRETCLESMERVKAVAEIIIPGHGPPFTA